MKISINLLFLALFTLTFIIAACSYTNNTTKTISSQKMKEINQIAFFSDTLQPKQTLKFDFENYETAKLPAGWSEYYTGHGGTEWKVTNDNGNKVLAQLYSDNPGSHFNIVVNDSISAKDMVLTVRIKGVDGKKDQGGGFVWRYIDNENYYIVRENPLENNVVLYKVQNGSRTDLPLIGSDKTYGVDVPAIGDTWHTLKLIIKGDLFTVFLDNKELFKVQDNTFPNSGKVGLWTKSDAVTYFDNFDINIYN